MLYPHKLYKFQAWKRKYAIFFAGKMKYYFCPRNTSVTLTNLEEALQ
jgi:hypothetical protein